MSVIFESGLQHFADRPSGYYTLSKEPREFLKSFPAAWDETILLDGYPGEYVLMARRYGNKWYLAGINGTNDTKTFVLRFPFLNEEILPASLIALAVIAASSFIDLTDRSGPTASDVTYNISAKPMFMEEPRKAD